MSQWHGCYDLGWKGVIVDEAMSHPAKMARNLTRRIYQHAEDQGWVKPGDIVVDPFGGIAGTALEAGIRGLRWIGCELEEKFHQLGNQNIELWGNRYYTVATWRRPVLLNGDSRKLSEVMVRANIILSSPPYASGQVKAINGIDCSKMKDGNPGGPNSQARALNYGQSDGQLGEMKEGKAPTLVISSPPYSTGEKGHPSLGSVNKDNWGKDGRDIAARRGKDGEYGQQDGQLSVMREGEAPRLVISSPPYAEIATGAGGLNTKPPKHEGQQGGRSPKAASQDTGQRYGESEGQLARMVMGSPPFTGSEQPCASQTVAMKDYEAFKHETKHGAQISRSETEGQIGAMEEETFWSASATIIQECHKILVPGGHAIWVTKDFVRNKKRVPFSDQWQALCEQHGFKLVCRHQALLVTNHGEQDDLFGETKQLTTERKSFFRRLAEKKGSPRIDHEDVICLQKI